MVTQDSDAEAEGSGESDVEVGELAGAEVLRSAAFVLRRLQSAGKPRGQVRRS